MKKWAFFGAVVIVAALVFFLWRAGMLQGVSAMVAGLLAIIGGWGAVQNERLREVRRQVEEARGVVRAQEKALEELRRRHDEEVAKSEETGGDASFDELLRIANERERKRKRNMGE